MKRTILTILTATFFAVLTLGAQDNSRKQEKDTLYFKASQMPDAVVFLPAPPSDSSLLMKYDISRYEWGKTLRDTPRGELSKLHATTKIPEMCRLFSESFGMEISKEKTPAIYRLIKKSIKTIRLGATGPKQAYMRKRPFVVYGEKTITPKWDKDLAGTGSYPSGHSIRGWGMALLLSEINPAAQNALLSYGFEWGESRVIGGYHWQSDVDASRVLASACYARLHTNADFLRDMQAAREEFQRLSAEQGK